MLQKKLFPIQVAKNEYDDLVRLLDSMNVDYSETEWLTIHVVDTGEDVDIKTVAAVMDDSEILAVMKEMKYQFV